MYSNFSRRHHLDHVVADLKYEDLSRSFRFEVLKLVQAYTADQGVVSEYALYRGASISINADYFQLHGVDDIHEFYSPDLFVDLLQSSKWHEILSIIEFLVVEGPLTENEVSQVFEYFNIGYEITSEYSNEPCVVVKYSVLIRKNEDIIESEIPHQPVVDAIERAKKALIDPQDIDAAASVSYSIQAVEAYLRAWLTQKSLKASTLGEAVKIIRKHSLCPVHIITALEQFYIFRNRTENVGHGAPTYAVISREDALLCNEMAISFINYFHRKETQT